MSQLDDLSPMPFGKYKGVPMQDIPYDYFHWLWDRGIDKSSPVGRYIVDNLDALKMENKDLIWQDNK